MSVLPATVATKTCTPPGFSVVLVGEMVMLTRLASGVPPSGTPPLPEVLPEVLPLEEPEAPDELAPLADDEVLPDDDEPDAVPLEEPDAPELLADDDDVDVPEAPDELVLLEDSPPDELELVEAEVVSVLEPLPGPQPPPHPARPNATDAVTRTT
ncbi:MAG: hypothetical protein AB2A00_29100 [Myxococcota bacterium]